MASLECALKDKTAGPRPISIEEYRKRQQEKTIEEDPKIPKVTKPKRRGGRINKLKRERAMLTREANTDVSAQKSQQLWDRINFLQFLIQQHINVKSK